MSKKNKAFTVKRLIIDMVITFVIAIMISFSFNGVIVFKDPHSISVSVLYGFSLGFFLLEGNKFLSYVIQQKYAWDINPIKTLNIHIIYSIILNISVPVILNYIYLKYVLHIKFNIFSPDIIISIFIALFITLSFYFKNFFKWWKISMENEKKLKLEAAQYQYDALKNQINPHFLFNSLSVLSALIETDTQKAQIFIQKFANIYRYVLEHKDDDVVTLKEELEFCNSYMELHKIRHAENLKIETAINDTSGYVVPLSLQIIVENCFKHNIISEEKPLYIHIKRENDYIIIYNNLQKRNSLTDVSGTGLNTLNKKYEHLANKSIDIKETENFFTVKIPVLKADNMTMK